MGRGDSDKAKRVGQNVRTGGRETMKRQSKKEVAEGRRRGAQGKQGLRRERQASKKGRLETRNRSHGTPPIRTLFSGTITSGSPWLESAGHTLENEAHCRRSRTYT